MKTKYALFFGILLSSSLMAQSLYYISVQNLLNTDRDAVFEVVQKNYPDKVFLDCQSFLHGINIIANEDRHFFYLYEPECREIYNFVSSAINKNIPACVTLDFEQSSYNLSNKNISCKSKN